MIPFLHTVQCSLCCALYAIIVSVVNTGDHECMTVLISLTSQPCGTASMPLHLQSYSALKCSVRDNIPVSHNVPVHPATQVQVSTPVQVPPF